jgi:hypothetical protein
VAEEIGVGSVRQIRRVKDGEGIGAVKDAFNITETYDVNKLLHLSNALRLNLSHFQGDQSAEFIALVLPCELTTQLNRYIPQTYLRCKCLPDLTENLSSPRSRYHAPGDICFPSLY